MEYRSHELRRLAFKAMIAALLWTLLVGLSLYTNLSDEEEGATALALNTARANFMKDQAFRQWASHKGGLYTLVDDKTRPVPFMSHVPDRDIVTGDGRMLTLLNPNTILREIAEQFGTQIGIHGRIVGLITLNPDNRADLWEEQAIHAFEKGATEIHEVARVNGEPQLRFIRPMLMTAPCMKCHGHLGFKVGDVRGAVGINVPLAAYLRPARARQQKSMQFHGGIWLFGLLGGGVYFRSLRRHEREREKYLTDLALAGNVFDNGPTGIVVTTPGGGILKVNRAYVEMTGYTQEEVLGQRNSLLKSGLHEDAFYQAMWRRIRERGEWHGEMWNRRRNGELFAVSQHISTIPGEDGTPRFLVGMFEDITERKKADAALKDQAQEIQWLMKSMASAFVVWETVFDPDGSLVDIRFVYFNDAYERASGLKLEEARGKTVKEIWPETEPEWFEIYGQVARTGEARSFELTHAPTQGTYACTAYRPWDTSDRICVVFEDVTERKHAETDLLESEARYREAQNIAHLGHWSFDTGSQRFLWLSDETIRLVGFDADAEVRDYAMFMDLVLAEDRDRVNQVVEHAISSGEGFVVDYRVSTEDGGIRHLEARGECFRDDGGRVERLGGTVMDITERRAAEESLQVYKALAEASSDAIVMARPDDTRLTYANRAAHDLFGCDSERREMVGMPGSAFWPVEAHGQMVQVISEALKGNWRGDVRQQRKDGGQFEANATVFAIGGQSGKPRLIVAIIRDISARKQVEEELRTANNKMESIIDFLPDATFVLDTQGRVIAWNRTMEQMTGVIKKDILGQGDHAHARAFYGASRPMLIDLVLNPELDGEATYPFFERHGELLMAEGHTPEAYGGRGAYVWGVAVPLRDPSGTVIGAIECVRDITKSKEAEEALRLSEERLRLALEGTSDGIWDWDVRTGQAYFSPRYYTMLGYEPGEFPATYSAWRALQHPEDSRGVEAQIQESLGGGGKPIDMEFRMRAKDGAWRWIHSRGKPAAWDEEGRPIRYAGSHTDITERKQAEDSLRFTQFAIDHASVAFEWLSDQGQVVASNIQAYQALGYTREEFIGLHVWDYDPDFSAERWAALWERLKREGSAFMETRHRRKDGSIFPIEVAVNHVAYGDKEYCFAYINDITGRKQAEEALRLTQFAIDHSSVAFEWLNIEGQVVGCNIQAHQSLGLARDEFIGMRVWEFTPEATSERWQAHLAELRRKGHDLLEAEHRRKDGSVFPVEIRANHVTFGEQEFVFSYLTDITERKRAEDALRLTQYVLDQARDAVFWIDEDARITYVNEAACQSLGYTREELTRLKVFDIDPVFPREKWAEHWREASQRESSMLETMHRTKSGEIHPVEIAISTVRQKDSVFHCAFSRDISERKETERALRDLNANLERRVREEVEQNREKDHLLIQQSRLAAMGEMIGNIAHQWRQPINALSLLLDNVKDAYEFGDLSQDYLAEQVKRGGQLIQRMSSTIDDFRNFFRPDRIKQPFAISGAARDAMAIIDSSYASARIELVLEVEHDAQVQGFHNEYAQVVLNLLSNAKDAILSRGIQGGRVVLRVDQLGDEARLEVTDNGGGIPEDVLPKVFDPYFTTREKGTGIGLYMSKMIIEKNMDGRIEVGNTDQGARIVVVIPVTSAAREAVPASITLDIDGSARRTS